MRRAEEMRASLEHGRGEELSGAVWRRGNQKFHGDAISVVCSTA